jgi:cytochrome c2
MSESRFANGTAKPGETVTITLDELNELIDRADVALDGYSNDEEHDALFWIREELSEYLEDPDRRKQS